MTPGRIQDPEGAKTVVVSFKTAAGAILVVQRQTFKIVSFMDTNSGRLRVDTAATTGGRHDMNKHGRRVILIYKAHMYKEATLDPKDARTSRTRRPGAYGFKHTYVRLTSTRTSPARSEINLRTTQRRRQTQTQGRLPRQNCHPAAVEHKHPQEAPQLPQLRAARPREECYNPQRPSV